MQQGSEERKESSYAGGRPKALCDHCGCMWKRKMSFLEMMGWTFTLGCFPYIVNNVQVTTRIDNVGSVMLLEHGYNLR